MDAGGWGKGVVYGERTRGERRRSGGGEGRGRKVVGKSREGVGRSSIDNGDNT